MRLPEKNEELSRDQTSTVTAFITLQVTSAEVSGHFGTSAELSCGQFDTGAEVPRVRSVLGPKCPWSEVSWVRGVQGLKCLYTSEFK